LSRLLNLLHGVRALHATEDRAAQGLRIDCAMCKRFCEIDIPCCGHALKEGVVTVELGDQVHRDLASGLQVSMPSEPDFSEGCIDVHQAAHAMLLRHATG
jgi:hypothetical protein